MRFLIMSALLGLPLFAQTLPQLPGYTETTSFGMPSVWNVGDIDGDGLDDIGVTSRGLSAQGSSAGTQVTSYVVPSTTGLATVLSTPSAVVPGGLIYAKAFLPIEDRDGDGVEDFVGLFPREGGTVGSMPAGESIRFYSGLTLTEIAGVPFTLGDSITGFASAGDRNADGVEDFVVTYFKPSVSIFATPDNRVEILDGATLSRTLLLTFSGDLFAGGLVRVGDVDADGVDDFVSGSPAWSDPLPNIGSTTVFSGVDGFPIGHLTGQNADDALGTQIVDAGDLNGDGIHEVASLEAGFSGGSGRVRVIDPTTASVVRSLVFSDFSNTDPQSNGILEIKEAGDHDGDGIQDLAVVLGEAAIPLVTSALPREIQWVRGSDGVPFHSAPFGNRLVNPPTAGVLTSSWPVGDVNGDGIDDVARAPLSQSSALPRDIEVGTMLGAQSYGTGVGGRLLGWVPGAISPAQGALRLQGVQPGAPLIGALSLAPANTTIFGTPFPLLVSVAPQDLILTTNEVADGLGSLTVPSNLSVPALSGFRLYVQYAELGLVPGTSNALELLLGPVSTLP